MINHLDDRIPVWPPDISAILYGRISNPEWQVPDHDTSSIARRFNIEPSFEYSGTEPLTAIHQLTSVYKCLSDSRKDTLRRAEDAVCLSVRLRLELNRLPLGIAAPIREASRACQLAPPSDWPPETYKAIGRNDLAASASNAPEMRSSDGYRAMKDYIVSQVLFEPP